MKRFWSLTTILLFGSMLMLSAADKTKSTFSGKYTEQTIKVVLKDLKSKTGVSVKLQKNVVSDSRKVTASFHKKSPAYVLNMLFDSTHVITEVPMRNGSGRKYEVSLRSAVHDGDSEDTHIEDTAQVEEKNNISPQVTSTDSVSVEINPWACKGDSLMVIMQKYQQRDSVLSDVKMARMLLRYPLFLRYDSAQVAYSVTLIEALGLEDNNHKMFELLYPSLKNYGEYNNEIINVLDKCVAMAKSAALTMEYFEYILLKTRYREECNTPVKRIPYIEQRINELYRLLKRSVMVSVDELKEIRADLL